MTKITLIGAGGHAKVIADSLRLLAIDIEGFIDPKTAEFLNLIKLADDHSPKQAVLSFGGVTAEELERRYKVYSKYSGTKFHAIIHPKAIIASDAKIADAVTINAGAIVNSAAKIGEASIINSGAIIEHDAIIGKGCHIAPNAVILGGAEIGDFCMIGANAVILPGKKIASRTLIKALTR